MNLGDGGNYSFGFASSPRCGPDSEQGRPIVLGCPRRRYHGSGWGVTVGVTIGARPVRTLNNFLSNKHTSARKRLWLTNWLKGLEVSIIEQFHKFNLVKLV